MGLIKRALILSTNSTDLILDFFAGSGTTGDAVMQLNAEDGGNRKYILVQLPEEIDPKKNKAAYDFVKELNTQNATSKTDEEPTIFDITRERLLRAAKKINAGLDEKTKIWSKKMEALKNELPTEETKAAIKDLEQKIAHNSKLTTQNCFKVFETMPIWDDYDLEADEMQENLVLFDETKLTAEDVKAMFLTWKTYDGIGLTETLQTVDLKGYTAHYGKGKLYLMDKGFSTDTLCTLLEKIDSDKNFNPMTIIAWGYFFESKVLREISESVKSYANKKKSDIDFITRY